jgi:hypothetical protein
MMMMMMMMENQDLQGLRASARSPFLVGTGLCPRRAGRWSRGGILLEIPLRIW